MGSALNDGDILHNYHICPVGSIIAWVKSYTNTPALGEAWVECNGQVISDAESPYNGQNAPDLNSSLGAGLKGRFLRGHSISGLTESSQNLAHTHVLERITSGGAGAAFGTYQGTASANDDATLSDGGDEARPSNYSVVWIMRIK